MNKITKRKVRLGMVGGGQGAFIGAIHRISAQLDNKIELVCGAFSRDPEKAVSFAKSLFLAKDRCYASYQAMFAAEAALPSDQRIDMVAIVTPNHLHFPITKMALEHGFHVICDKPATLTLAEALTLKDIIAKTDRHYGLTHTYTGYPMVKEAKHRIAQGQLGRVKKVIVEYPQGWLAKPTDSTNKQASWRLDPKQAGISCCMADIGVHAANLAEYVTGLQITEICADLSSNIDDRVLDDDGTVMLRFNSGAHGVLLASQICTGEENSLKLRVYTEKACLEWSQLEPNSLWLKYADQATQLIRAGVGNLAETTLSALRTPAGHPEGYLEAFANLYLAFAQQITNDSPLSSKNDHIPGINDAIRGMAFIENVVAASQSELKWHTLSLTPCEIKPRTQLTQGDYS